MDHLTSESFNVYAIKSLTRHVIVMSESRWCSVHTSLDPLGITAIRWGYAFHLGPRHLESSNES